MPQLRLDTGDVVQQSRIDGWLAQSETGALVQEREIREPAALRSHAGSWGIHDDEAAAGRVERLLSRGHSFEHGAT
jgi:hypothetical protein